MIRWSGKTREEVISSWGEPHGETPLRDGRRVLTWTWRWGFWIVGGTCRQSLTLGSEGVVEEWSYSRCPPFVSR
jgi:hypothetical protein